MQREGTDRGLGGMREVRSRRWRAGERGEVRRGEERGMARGSSIGFSMGGNR